MNAFHRCRSRIRSRTARPCHAPFRGGAIAALLLLLVAGAPATLAGYSGDEPPTHTLLDPGDVRKSTGSVEISDGTCPPPPLMGPCLGVPSPGSFDLDAYSIDAAEVVCPSHQVTYEPGVLFSFDDGDPAPKGPPPDFGTEIFYYDRCARRGGGSFHTAATETALGLGNAPPPWVYDDDVDAFDVRDSSALWSTGFAILFSPDSPSTGGLAPSASCAGSTPQGNVYASDRLLSSQLRWDPCQLGVPDVVRCDVDALALVTGEPQFPEVPRQVLFSTDAGEDCGLDPGDIYISDGQGHSALWADDVVDLRIAYHEDDAVDIDALSVAAPGAPALLGTYVPPPSVRWSADYPDHAPSGTPDFSQDRGIFPAGPSGGTTGCGPTALADALWWLDSRFEGSCGGAAGDGADRHPLVQSYGGAADDHLPANVDPLIGELALCAGTDFAVPGSLFADLRGCAVEWIADRGLQSSYRVSSSDSPDLEQIACAAERGEQVVLLLGTWWYDDPIWRRCGGHYVTVAGVQLTRRAGPDGRPGWGGVDDDGDGQVDEADELCPCGPEGLDIYGDDVCFGAEDRIAISDPGLNNAEPAPAGKSGPGRIEGAEHETHSPMPSPASHDDPHNVSHDLYIVEPSGTGLYLQSLKAYGAETPGQMSLCQFVLRFCGQNPHDPSVPMEPCLKDHIASAEIEALLRIAPRVTPVCLDVRQGPESLRLHKNFCPDPLVGPRSFDFVRGELCQLREAEGQVDLGRVDYLRSDSPLDQLLDAGTPDEVGGLGAWFFLVREDRAPEFGASSAGNPRRPAP